MVGIVGILLLGSLAWSAVGALFSALGEVWPGEMTLMGWPAASLCLARLRRMTDRAILHG